MNRYFASLILLSLITGPALFLELQAGDPVEPFKSEGLELLAKGRSAFMASDDDSDNLYDQLRLVAKGQDGEVHTRADINWAIYSDVQLGKASVTFIPDWQRDQNRFGAGKVRDDDLKDIKNTLSALFGEIVTKELTSRGGYNMTTASGDHVLLIKPSITDLDIKAPDTRSAGYSNQLADSTIKMTLNLEFYDSMSGEVLAIFTDRLEDPRRGYLQRATSSSNRNDAKRLLRQWSADLLQKMQTASGNDLAFNTDQQN